MVMTLSNSSEKEENRIRWEVREELHKEAWHLKIWMGGRDTYKYKSYLISNKGKGTLK